MQRMRPRPHIFGAFLLLLFLPQGIATANEPTNDDIAFRKEVYVGKKDRLPYRLFVPLGYEATRKYPLLLWLHGTDGRGNDNVRQLTHENQLSSAFLDLRRGPTEISDVCPRPTMPYGPRLGGAGVQSAEQMADSGDGSPSEGTKRLLD